MVTIPTTAQIYAQIVSDIEGAIGQTAPVLPKAVVRVTAAATAGPLTLAYRFGLWVAKQIFTQTADEAALIRRGEQYGITWTPAVAAVLTATLTGTDTTGVPAGTLWRGDENGVIYEQDAAAEIAAGTASISVTALTAGDAGNLAASKTLSINAPIAGLNSTATVTATTTTGEDAEDIEDFRARVLQRQQNTPQGGAAPDWVGWALEVAGIVAAFAFRTDDGIVTVYPLLATTGASRVPDASKLTEVKDYLDDTSVRPLGARVLTAAMTELTFDVDVVGLLPNTAEVRSAVEAAWTSYMYERYPRQYDDEIDPTDRVSAAELYGLAVDAGAYELTLTLKKSGLAIGSYQLQYFEIATLGTVTYA